MENEKRLIDANALRKKAIWGKIRQGTVYESDAKLVTVGAIDTAPTVDAVEVVHGRWEFDDPVSPNCSCSICGSSAPLDLFGDYHSERTNYCPNCGADMRERK